MGRANILEERIPFLLCLSQACYIGDQTNVQITNKNTYKHTHEKYICIQRTTLEAQEGRFPEANLAELRQSLAVQCVCCATL